MTSGVACDSKNNLYVAGSFFNTLNCNNKKLKSAGNQDIFIAKFDEQGSLKDMWSGGGKGQDEATCICATKGNSVVVGGLLTDTAAFDKLKSNGKGLQLFVTNLDAKGKFTWVKTLSITGDASLFLIDTDTDGNIYVSGTFSGTLTADALKVTSNGKKDIFLARLNPAGSFEKLSAFGGEEDDIPSSMSVSDSGKIALAGVFGKPFQVGEVTLASLQKQAKTNAFIIVLDKDFNAGWANILSGEEYCQVASLRHDAQGNLYATGSFNLNLWLNDTTLTSKGYTDAFLLKYSPNGKLLWSRGMGSWYYDYANSVNLDNLGGVVVTGSIGDTLEIDSLIVTPVSERNAALVMQFSSEGKATWGDCISGKGRNFSNGAVLDKKGNLYFTGSFNNTFAKEDQELTSYGDQDVFLAKYYNCLTNKAEIFGDTTVCPGVGTELSIKRGFKNVVWNDTVKETNAIVAEKPGLYWVTMLDKLGCLLTDTVTVVNAKLPVFTLGNDTTLPVSKSLLLKAPKKYSQYLWQDHSTDPVYLARATDGKPGSYNYWLSVKDSLGCTWADTMSIYYVTETKWIDAGNIQMVTYPNPVADWLYYYLNTDQPCKMIVELVDEHGKVLYNQYIAQYSPGELMKIDVSHLPMGPYYIRLNNPSSGSNYKSACIIKL
jgi:hypothetical protein